MNTLSGIRILINFSIYFPEDREVEAKLIGLIRSAGGYVKGKRTIVENGAEWGNLYGKCPPQTLLTVAGLGIKGLSINEKPGEKP